MDLVDKIRLLSEKGYAKMESREFFVATDYFMNAASLAKKILLHDPNNGSAQSLFSSLIHLARNAESLSKNGTEVSLTQSKNESLSFLTAAGVNVEQPTKQVIYNNFHGNPVINQSTESESVDPIKTKRRKSPKKITSQKSKDLIFSYQSFEPNLVGDGMFELLEDNFDQFKYHIGNNLSTNENLIWKPSSLMNSIVTITGGSGSGKTQCIRLLAHKLTLSNIPCLIFDLHGDIDIGIETISLDYKGEFGINPMELTSKSQVDGGPVPHINRLMNQFAYAVKTSFSSTQQAWLRGLLLFSYKQYGIIQSQPETWSNKPPDFRYLLDLIKNPDKLILESRDPEGERLLELVTKSTKVAVENRLVEILEHPAFYARTKVPIEDLRENSYRILLKPLNTIDMQFLASDTIIRQIFAYFKSLGHVKEGEKKLRLFIIIDEVKVLTGYKGKMNDPYHILNVIATEARKFGVGMILASQVLGHFGRDIKSNAATKLILRTMDNDETKKASKEMKIPLDKISSITRPGEGFFITSLDQDATHVQLLNIEEILSKKSN